MPIVITTASQTTLQATITHHGTIPNNLDLVPTLVNLYPQQLIVVIANISPTVNAPTFAIHWGNSFKFLN
jgi:hypothetical protein